MLMLVFQTDVSAVDIYLHALFRGRSPFLEIYFVRP